ncbi:MAG: tryptophan-rich sensory protein [Verrucomicrobiota bacterium]
MNRNLITAGIICLAAAALEGICAGTGIKDYFRRLKWPSYSPPLLAWYAIAAGYYAILFICAYRILVRSTTLPFRNIAFALLLCVVFLNAIWNLLFFRAKNLAATFVLSVCYSVVVVALWYCLSQFDCIAAAAIGVYGLYLIYANIWSYRLWRSNVGSA